MLVVEVGISDIAAVRARVMSLSHQNGILKGDIGGSATELGQLDRYRVLANSQHLGGAESRRTLVANR